MSPFKLIVSDSVHFFLANLGQIASLSLPFLLLGSIAGNLFFANPEFVSPELARFFSIALNLALHPVYTGALILLMARHARQERPKNGELLTASVGLYLPLLTLTVAGMTLVWAGLFCLILPGIWIAVRLAFADFFLVLEKLDPKMAILKSFQNTRIHFVLILTSLGIFSLPVLLLGIFAARMIEVAQLGSIALVLTDTTITFLSLFLEVVLFRIFMEAVAKEPRTA